jgi:hypothetical protein
MPTPRHPLRPYIIWLVRKGELASLREASLICDASEQAISVWLKRENIDLGRCRLERMARFRVGAQGAIRQATVRKPTGNQRRRDTLEAVKRFNDVQAKRKAPES